jgi:hypothetical protein
MAWCVAGMVLLAADFGFLTTYPGWSLALYFVWMSALGLDDVLAQIAVVAALVRAMRLPVGARVFA